VKSFWPLPAPLGFASTLNCAWSMSWPPMSLRRTIFMTCLERVMASTSLLRWTRRVMARVLGAVPCYNSTPHAIAHEGGVAPLDLHCLLVHTRTYVDDEVAGGRCCVGWGHGSKAQKQTLLSEVRTSQPSSRRKVWEYISRLVKNWWRTTNTRYLQQNLFWCCIQMPLRQ
jgi:hypothetical protein